ncbi:archease [Candidatus Woesearchaeota archaeon]|nr:archease [Candidatus Woesearchaeota archaeon]
MPAKPPFKFVDRITSDVMFEAYGRDKKELFVNAALAVSHVLCKVDQVKPKIEKEIKVEADSSDDLLVNWLHAIISRVDIDEMFFSKFTIIELTDTRLRAFAYGEPSSPAKGLTVVKAVTYYEFKLEKTSDGWMCRVSLDI